MDPISGALPQFGEILEQGQQTALNTVKSAVSDTTNAVSGQIGIKNENNHTTVTNQNQNQPAVQAQGQLPNEAVAAQNLQNEETAEMVKDYYAPSTQAPQTPKPQTQEEYETQQKLLKIRQELHERVYYDPLFAYEHKKQERPADVQAQEEEQKKMAELEHKKEEKKLPLAVQRAQTSVEVNRGVSG